MLHDVPSNLRYYFDEDRYIDDVLRYDGRGHLLSSYDGSEEEVRLSGNDFFKKVCEYFEIDPSGLTDEEEAEVYSRMEEEDISGDGTWYYIYRVN
jgi:hypothetical protein